MSAGNHTSARGNSTTSMSLSLCPVPSRAGRLSDTLIRPAGRDPSSTNERAQSDHLTKPSSSKIRHHDGNPSRAASAGSACDLPVPCLDSLVWLTGVWLDRLSRSQPNPAF